jgi:hypothetical protein
MSARTRTLEILTQAGLADKELERERLKAQREAQQQQSVLGALSILGGTAIDAGGKVYGVLEQGAQEDARAASLRGDLDNGVPEQEQKDPLSSFIDDPLGLKKKATNTAAAERKNFLSERARADAKEQEKLKREQDEKQRQEDRAAAIRAQELEVAEAQKNEQREYDAARAAERMEYDQSIAEQKEAAALERIRLQNEGKKRPAAKGGARAADPEVADAKRQKVLDDARKAKALADAAERKATSEGEGRNLPASVAQGFGEAEYAAAAAEQLAGEVTPEDFTSLRRSAALIPGGTTAAELVDDRSAKINRAIDRFVQNAGKSLEGGKLAEGDAQRYKKMLLRASDSHETFVEQANAIAAEIRQKTEIEKQALRAQGFRVGGGAQPTRSAPSAPPTPSGSTITPRGRDAPSFADIWE